MKNRLLVLLFIFSSCFSMAKLQLETQIKFGYDFYRRLASASNWNEEVYKKLDSGFNFNLEFIPFNIENRLELGVGIGYTGGLFNFFPSYYNDSLQKKENILYSVPIYALAKVNIVNLENEDSVLYTDFRLGYTATGSLKENDKFSQGFGFGVGIGTEYKYFVGAFVYDGTLTKANVDTFYKGTDQWVIFHRFGLQLGIRFGYTNAQKPEIVEVTPTIIEEPVVETPKEKGIFIKNIVNSKDTGLKLEEFEENNLPDILYIKEDGYLYTTDNKLYGSNGDTDAENVFIEKDGDIVFYNGSPMVLKVFKTNGKEFSLLKDDKGTKIVAKVEEKVEKVAFFPNKCYENKCTINGFVTNANKTNAQEIEQLKYFVETLNNYAKSAEIEIIGHTDSQGSLEYNKALGLRRAKGIHQVLEGYGLNKSLKVIEVKSAGEESPIETNSTSEGRYKNRRVEIIFHNMDK